MSGDRWAIAFERRADKDLDRLDAQVKRRVLEAIGRLADDPANVTLRQLQGRSELRMRVGDWRVLLDLDKHNETIVICRVLPRGREYDR